LESARITYVMFAEFHLRAEFDFGLGGGREFGRSNLDDTERAGLPYDHRHMCKFESRSSPGYRLIVAALIRYSNGASIPFRSDG
jgi:hypothetical protein